MTEHPLSQEESRLPLVAACAALKQVSGEVQRQQAMPPIPGGHWRRLLLLLLMCISIRWRLLLLLLLLLAAAAAAMLQRLL